MNYLTNISFYLSLKAAGTNNIRNHPVIGALVELRATIEKMEKLASKLQPQLEHFIEHLDEPVNSLTNKSKKASSKKAAKPVLDRESDEEDDGSDLYSDNDDFFDNDDEDDQNADSIEQEFKSLKKQANKRKRAVSDNDFGDLDMMEEVDMEDKLAKKRSIRDYVAKIETVSQDKYSMKQSWPTPLLHRNKPDNNRNTKVIQIYLTRNEINDKRRVSLNLRTNLPTWIIRTGTNRILVMLKVMLHMMVMMTMTIPRPSRRMHQGRQWNKPLTMLPGHPSWTAIIKWMMDINDWHPTRYSRTRVWHRIARRKTETAESRNDTNTNKRWRNCLLYDRLSSHCLVPMVVNLLVSNPMSLVVSNFSFLYSPHLVLRCILFPSLSLLHSHLLFPYSILS